MLEIVSTALLLITKSQEDADLLGLTHLRGEMVQVLDAYCHHVHEVGDPGLIQGCTQLQAAYETFRARWVHRNGMAHWHEYRLSAVVMMKRVRSVVEEAEKISSPSLNSEAQAS